MKLAQVLVIPYIVLDVASEKLATILLIPFEQWIETKPIRSQPRYRPRQVVHAATAVQNFRLLADRQSVLADVAWSDFTSTGGALAPAAGPNTPAVPS